ncbi:MAG TPA: stage V sporulation protein SpoVM [Ruminococcaceae bacterium]|nr:stage V sporulation protein SpoVM [Oscillospiraceae bacterium]
MQCADRVLGGTARRVAAARKGSVHYRGDRPDHHLYCAPTLSRRGDHKEAVMKVVVLDHPKILGFFLRKIYGIKKIKETKE